MYDPPANSTVGSRNRFGDLVAGARRQAARASRDGPGSSLGISIGLNTECADLRFPSHALPGYELLREVHRGGQGVVYEGFQKSTRRRVAIKVTREGPFVSPADRARFDREVQILGQLRHPNIVAIHDSGETAGGCYFVMEYISGFALDEHVRHVKTTNRQDHKTKAGEWEKHAVHKTIELFAKICDAVNAAHLKGVIHRDLKPGNIRIDEQGEPHVLDFGLAKVAAFDSSGPAMTLTGEFMGSLPWASPEQAEAVPTRIDMRTDVYSLGVMFYQILAGRFPYQVVGSMREVLDRIVNTPPAPLSDVAVIDNEIATIVLKCLAKEPERRYQTAGELSRDIKHYLAGEPIEAKRDSGWYVLRKTLRRHRAKVGIAAAFAGLLLFSSVVSTVLYVRAREQQMRAEANERRARESAALAVQNANETRQVSEFQAQMLADVNPEEMGLALRSEFRRQVERGLERRWVEDGNGGSRRLTREELAKALSQFDAAVTSGNPTDVARHILDTMMLRPASQALDNQFEQFPLVAAALRRAVGKTYLSLALIDKAEAPLRNALATRRKLLGENLDVAASASDLAALLSAKGDYAAAEALNREALDIRLKLLGKEHPDVAKSLTELAVVIKNRGDHAAAEPLLVEALRVARLSADESDDMSVLSYLSDLFMAQGKYDAVEPLQRELLGLTRRKFGDKHSEVASVLNGLALVLKKKGQYAAAEPLYREALAVRKAALGDEHPLVAQSCNNLAMLLHYQGDHKAAEPLHHESLAILRKVYGDAHPHLATSLNNLAGLLKDQGRFADAESLYREALTMRRSLLGAEHPEVAESLNNLAALLDSKGEGTTAEPLYRKALNMRRKLLGDDHPDVAQSLNNLARLLSQQGDGEAAEPLAREALRIYEKRLPARHPNVANGRISLAGVLAGRGQYQEAEGLLLEAWRNVEETPKIPPSITYRCAQNLAALYESWHGAEPRGGYQDKATRWRRKLAELQSTTQPSMHLK